MDRAFDEIAGALDAYFDGFYEGDVEKLKQIFHPAAHLYCATEGPLQDDPMEVVYTRVRGRTPPSANGQKRKDRIISIDRSGPEAALAKVQLAIGPRLFTDFLTLLRVDGRWQIISKTYSWVPIEAEPAIAAAA
jgi:4-oxalocrotonate tautomerase